MNPSSEPLKCVTLDLDDTLWDCPPVIIAAEKAFYDWLSIRYPRIAEHYELSDLVGHRREFFQQLDHNKPYDLTFLRKRWLTKLGEEWGHGDALVEEGFEVFIAARNKVELYDGVPQMLETLSTRYKLGALTNGNADVHRIGIGHWFHFVVSAAEVQALKPAPAMFEAALDCAAVSPAQAVHVGDDPIRDVQGAADVGMRTVWLNADGAEWPGGKSPDAQVKTIRELSDVLAGWG